MSHRKSPPSPEAIVERFGRIHVWVDNAGLIAYGSFEEIPSEVFRQIVETNLMGQVHGARAALRRFRTQGSGVLINMSSVWDGSAPAGDPLRRQQERGSRLLRMPGRELVDEEDVHVTSMAPQAVDTPIFEHAGNCTGCRSGRFHLSSIPGR